LRSGGFKGGAVGAAAPYWLRICLGISRLFPRIKGYSSLCAFAINDSEAATLSSHLRSNFLDSPLASHIFANVNTFEKPTRHILGQSRIDYDYKSALTGTGDRSFVDDVYRTILRCQYCTFDGHKASCLRLLLSSLFVMHCVLVLLINW